MENEKEKQGLLELTLPSGETIVVESLTDVYRELVCLFTMEDYADFYDLAINNLKEEGSYVLSREDKTVTLRVV